MNPQNQPLFYYANYPYGYSFAFFLPSLENLSEAKREETPVQYIYNDASPILRAPEIYPEIKQEEVEYNEVIKKEELSHPFYNIQEMTIKEKLEAALEYINAKNENGEKYITSKVAQEFNLNFGTLRNYILRKAPHLRQRIQLHSFAVRKEKLNAALAHIETQREVAMQCFSDCTII